MDHTWESFILENPYVRILIYGGWDLASEQRELTEDRDGEGLAGWLTNSIVRHTLISPLRLPADGEAQTESLAQV